MTDVPAKALADELVEALGLPLDPAAVLAPVSDDAPAGVDLREDEATLGQYYRLRDARTSGRNREREALGDGEMDYIRPRDWQPLIDEVPAALATQSKDTELAAWLIEALTRVHGFRGAAVGFDLAAGLIETYGEQLHPRPDEDGVATQLAALAGLNGLGTEGALIAPLKSVPLTEGQSPAPFAAWQCEQAFDLARVSDASKREARSERGYVTREALDQAIAETRTTFLVELREGIRAAVTAFAHYRDALDRYTPDNPQPTSRIETALDECLRMVNYLGGERLASADHVAPDEPAVADDTTAEAEPPVASAPGIADRAAAVRQLREIARFFRQTEPHSPMSYAVEQVVRWSDLSLPELIQELIPDDGARSKYRTLTGIGSPDE